MAFPGSDKRLKEEKRDRIIDELLRRALLLESSGKYDHASVLYAKAYMMYDKEDVFLIDGREIDIFNHFFICLLLAGDHKNALKLVEKHKMHISTVTRWRLLSRVYKAMGEIENEIDARLQIRKKRPNDVSNKIDLANAYVRAGLKQDALNILSSIKKRSDEESLLKVISVFLDLEIKEEVRALLIKLEKKTFSPDLFYQKARLDKLDGDVNSAIKNLKKALARDPDHADSLRMMRRLMNEMGAYY